MHKAEAAHGKHGSVCVAGTYVMRLKEDLPVREVALHMGAIHGVDKMKKLQQLHFWKPNSWKVALGQPLIDRMLQVRAVQAWRQQVMTTPHKKEARASRPKSNKAFMVLAWIQSCP